MHAEPVPERRPRAVHPLRRKGEMQRRRLRRGIYLLPSLFTLANMFCGYACVVYSMRGEYETAAPFVGLAIILDMLDGRIARMTGTTSAFGREFDSLADVISFGMAPAIMTFAWGLEPLGRLGWAAGFVFVTGGATRLARFNIQATTDKRYFVGMPIPAAAAVPAATVYAYPAGLSSYQSALPALALMLIPAFLMVSTIKFRSFKTIDLHARRSYKVLVPFAVALFAIITHPKGTLIVLSYAYLVSAFIGMGLNKWKHRGGRVPLGEEKAAEPETVPEAGDEPVS
jgi:CDP-diacylglycerol---serine O-phosphatidyltransferase